MTQYFAFLRAINVGGHTVKMDFLRQAFEQLNFARVETFIASGNVIFETPSQAAAALEVEIESGLRAALGYVVTTFLRTPAELAALASYQPFSRPELESAAALNVAFLKSPLDETTVGKVQALTTPIDRFHIHEREIYWLCQKKQSESTISNLVLEKTTGKPSTLRGINTIQKLAEKYRPG